MYGYYPQFNQPMQPQYPTIYGKVVDSIETAKTQDVPFGQYAIFPKGNLAEIFVKSWENDGTTKTMTYIPEQNIADCSVNVYTDILNNIQQSLVDLGKKLDAFNKTPIKPMKKVGGSDAE